jgi:two-component system NtrC family sensor kinase
LGNFAFIPLLALGFAVMKHDLLDIGMAVKKGLLYSVLTGLLTAGYGLVIIFSNHIFKNMESRWSVALPGLFFVLIVIAFDPLKRRIQGSIDILLFKGKYDYQKTLSALSDAVTSMLDLDDIMGKILRALTDKMHLEWAYVLLKGDGPGPFIRKYRLGPIPAAQPVLAQTSLLVAELEERKRAVTRYALSERTQDEARRYLLEKDFHGLGATVIVPMICKGTANGLLVLGDKQSGDLFTGQDLELLRTLASQCAISIENAKAYRLIENLNANLERMVEQRTRELTTALEQKEKARELLIRSESLASVGALVAGVAHELNNPLASAYSLVQSSTETIEENRTPLQSVSKDTDFDEVLDDLHFSLKELNRAKEIVASLLGLSRQTQNYSEPIRINHVAKDALKILSNQYKKTAIAVTELFQNDLPRVIGNFANLGQVFLNILTNAIQAVDRSSGTILVRTWFDDRAGNVIFECSDNGPGIASEVMTDIFKPFFTTKSVGKGTGLGLYISHEIVRRHGGYILAKNNDGPGATFQVALPVDGKG